MEFALYLFVVVLAMILATQPLRFTQERFFFLFYMIVFVAHAQIVRLAGYDADIIRYADMMRVLQESLFVYDTPIEFYYYKEPAVWIGQAVLYHFLRDSHAVFTVYDTLIGLLLYHVFRNFQLPYYAYFAFLAYFPFILGFQNVYRQLVATLFVLWLFSMPQVGKGRALFIYILAFLAHHVAGVFVALFSFIWLQVQARLQAYYRGARSWKVTLPILIVFLIVLVTPLFLSLGADMKSSGETGANLTLVYVGTIGAFLLLFMVTGRFRVREDEFAAYFALVTCLWVTFVAAQLLSSAGTERIGLFSMILLYPLVVQRLELLGRFRPLWRVGLVLGGFVPILAFGTRAFLFSG